MPPWRSISEFLALRRNTSILLIALVLAGTGERLWVGFVPKYLQTLGAGGFFITRCGWLEGVRYALSLCLVLTTLTMVFQWLMIEPQTADSSAAPFKAGGFLMAVKSFTPALRELLISDILIRFCERIPYAFVILWAMNDAHVSAQQFGLLISIEMITAMFCYIPVAHMADKYGRRPFVLATFVFFTLFPVTLMWANSFGWLAFAFAVRGLKEFGEPARKALIIAEAVPELRTRTYGAYYLIRDCVVTTGSFLGAWLWSIGPRANFLGAAICGALGTLWFWWFIFRRGAQAPYLILTKNPRS